MSNTRVGWMFVLSVGMAGLIAGSSERAAWSCPPVAPQSVPKVAEKTVAYLGFDQDQGYRNVSFSGSGSYDPDGGPIVQYSWVYQADPFPDEARYHQCSFTETFDEPGAYTQIKLYVTDDEQQTDWEYCHLYLVEPVLNVDYAGESMDDPDEYDEGAFVWLNDDDDNDNGVPDNDPSETTVQGEDDLLSLEVWTDPPAFWLEEGQLTLEIVSGTSKIKVWRYTYKGTELTLPKTWPIGEVLGETFYIEGVDLSGSLRDVELKLTYSCGSESSVDKVTITVLGVESVAWVGVDPGDGYTGLSDDNPASHGGGWRVFPGKNTPTGELHDKVKAKATINVTMPAGRTSKVYFQVFDMDDPTQNGADNVVDSNDTATAYNGADNKGSSPRITPTGMQEVTVSGGTDFAELEYTITSRNPGNNFRVVAHCLADYLDVVAIDTGAQKKGLDLKEGSTGGTVPEKYKTPLLSVWRKLHVEFDRMGNAPAGQFFAEIDGTSSSISTNSLTSQGNPGWAADSLHGAILNPDGNDAPNSLSLRTNWEVMDNTNNTVTVKTDYTTDTFDNDGQNGVDDEGEVYEMTPQDPSNKAFAIETDDPEWLTGLSPPTNAAALAALNGYFDDAYVECVEAEGNTQKTFDFNRNRYGPHGFNWDNPVDVQHSADFWAVEVGWCYESYDRNILGPCETHNRYSYRGDDDPENEGLPEGDGNAFCLRGVADSVCVDVFCETIRDEGLFNVLMVCAHEIGHVQGLDHADYSGSFDEDDKGIMFWEKPPWLCRHDWYALDPYDQGYDRFSNNNINQLRSCANPY